MAVRMRTPFDLMSGDIRRESHVRLDKLFREEEAPPPPPDTCRDLVSDVLFSDNFNRANNLSVGPNWIEYLAIIGFAGGYGFQVDANELLALGFQGPFPLGTPRTATASFLAMPDTTVNQTARLIFKGSFVASPPPFSLLDYQCLYGGPSVRIQQVAIGNDFDANQNSYTLRYQEDRSHIAPFDKTGNAFLDLWIHRPAGVSQMGVAPVAIPPLSVNDEVKLTAMNFFPGPGQTSICLKGYVNNVLKISTTIVSTHPFNALLDGRAGLSVGPSTGTVRGFAADWDDWQGSEAVPV